MEIAIQNIAYTGFLKEQGNCGLWEKSSFFGERLFGDLFGIPAEQTIRLPYNGVLWGTTEQFGCG